MNNPFAKKAQAKVFNLGQIRKAQQEGLEEYHDVKSRQKSEMDEMIGDAIEALKNEGDSPWTWMFDKYRNTEDNSNTNGEGYEDYYYEQVNGMDESVRGNFFNKWGYDPVIVLSNEVKRVERQQQSGITNYPDIERKNEIKELLKQYQSNEPEDV